jgi:hypothetical protein
MSRIKLTQSQLDRYVGGQIEITMPGAGEVYRGEIATAVLDGDVIHFTMTWMAANTFPPNDWTKDDKLTYDLELRVFFTIQDIGPGSEGGNRLLLESPPLDERIVLYPPDGSRLDPSRVVGLVLPAGPPPASAE